MDLFKNYTPTPLEWCDFNREGQSHRIGIKRDDLPGAVTAGNKFRKLRYHPCFQNIVPDRQLVSMGGGHSNLILALTFLGYKCGYQCHFFTSHTGSESWLMKECRLKGAQFHTVSRSTLRLWRKSNQVPEEVQYMFPNGVWIPEGGGGPWSERGLSELIQELVDEVGTRRINLLAGAGTGVTSRYLLKHLPDSWKLWVFPALRSESFRQNLLEMSEEQGRSSDFGVLYNPEDRGIGNLGQSELSVIGEFWRQCGVLLDPFYNGKAFGALFGSESPIDKDTVLIHSGGIQAWIGLAERFPESEEIFYLAQIARKILNQNVGLKF